MRTHNRRSHGSHRRSALGIAALMAAGSMLLTPGTAWADNGENPATQWIPTMLILDASSSMVETDGDTTGITRMQEAKTAALNLVDQLDAEAQLGLLVYGANIPDSAGAASACQDVEVVVPVGTGNASALRNAINATEPAGYTPIGAALQEAAAALPAEGPRAIVLVSDGVDTCAPPPPCDVAQELAAEGVDLTVHTIGFRVDAAARADLACIADATGGTYGDAETSDQLADQLVRRATRSLQGYEISGTPIDTGNAITQALRVEPGQYADAFQNATGPQSEGETKYYRIAVEEGQRVIATATVVPPPRDAGRGSGNGVDLDIGIVNGNDRWCAPSNTWDSTFGASAVGVPRVQGVHSLPFGPDNCAAGDVFLKVDASAPDLPAMTLPYELTIAIEEPGLDEGRSAEAAERNQHPGATPGMDPGEITELGRSFTDATHLDPGTYAFELVPGDFGLLSIDVNEGQQLGWHIDIAEAEATGQLEDPYRHYATYNRFRTKIHPSGSHYSNTVRLDRPTTESGGHIVPTQLSNWTDGYGYPEQAASWVGGPHYMMLRYSTSSGTEAGSQHVPVRIVLTLQVDGAAGTNPEFITSVDPATEESVTEEAAEEETDANSNTEEPVRHDVDDTSEEGDGGSSPLVVGAVVAGVIALVAAGAGVLLVRRRKLDAG